MICIDPYYSLLPQWMIISNVTGDCYYQQINDNAVHYLSPAHIWPYSANFLKESIFKNYKKFWKHKFESFTLSF